MAMIGSLDDDRTVGKVVDLTFLTCPTGLRQDSFFSFLSPLSFESLDFPATSRLSPDSRKSPGSPVPQPESPSFQSREVPDSFVKPVSPRKVLKKPTSPPPVTPQAPK
ncbi:hypothetical protein chiPu_0021370, partial [Chiloscyllium punctatum]|nr:hypothetical protein [Chiloscyllium punctatum]